MARQALTDEERRAKNREKNRQWRAANQQKVKAQRQKWIEKNPEKEREMRRRWRENNPDKVKAARAREKAKPDYRERKHAAQEKWRKAPENRERYLGYYREYHGRPEIVSRERARSKARWQKTKNDPVLLAQNRQRWKKYYANKNPERSYHTGEALQAALNKNDLYATARASVPSYYPRHTRDDIISSIVLAVLEGDFTLAEIPNYAKKFISAYYKEADYYRTRSIDATIPGTDGLRLIDVLAAPEQEAPHVE